MAEEKLHELQNLIGEFNDISLSDFRDALQTLTKDTDPVVDRYLVKQLKNWSGNRTMRAVFAAALAEREDESYLEDFSQVIEKETDVGLCKECINGLTRIGTQEAIQKLHFLAKSKPNATIASLLQREVDKIKHEEKEPVHYYLENLAKGNENHRGCRHAAKVLVKMGDAKVVDTIMEAFDNYDDLARSEGSKVISQLGKTEHLERVLEILERYSVEHSDNGKFIETAESLDQQPKDQRLDLLWEYAEKLLEEEQEPGYQQFKSQMEDRSYDAARETVKEMTVIANPVGFRYFLESLVMILENKVAHANKYHEDTLREARIRQTRLRQLLAELAYGIGKIGGLPGVDPGLRERACSWLTRLVKSHDGDIVKMALYGCAWFAEPADEELLEATLSTHTVEGMTRLLTALERKPEADFSDFFLKVARRHEILDVQEMAMRSLGSSKAVNPKLRTMLEEGPPDEKRTALRIIGEIKAEEFKSDLIDLLEGQSDIIRTEAIASLGKFGDPGILPNIEAVMVDAKSPVLIEISLKAIAEVGGEEALAMLKKSAENSRNKKTSLTAVKLLVESYRSWAKSLPDSCNQLVTKQLGEWFKERDASMREDAYRIGANIVSKNLELYDTLKKMFKETASALRKQANWNKDEMALVENSVKMLNRSYFFLKEMLEFQKEVGNRCRGYDNPSSTARIGVFEKLTSLLENNAKFIISEENELDIEKAVLTGLELAEGNWREQNILFNLAGYTTSEKLKEELVHQVKDVVKQSRAALLDALSRMGMSLQDINDLTRIRKVLVLEGSGFMRKRVVKFLDGQGYETKHTDDLDIAYAMIKSEIPDLIISEITLSEPCDGAAFAEKLIGEYGSKIAWIFSTNHREASIMERVAKLRPKKIFHKPFPFDQLEEAIHA
ncbi:HEAT repeat domain-containing protein [Sulfidibacter corallicola]|uniref:HEAT repeat domain-containing protein n=1 Tax=Sulfidibacter corallicola TaxID=2818388 RepID=A0A8A4U515_SULCO|nr:HEAT repeat domain-containing protein [Sulfidibacter corallicola]QTD53835.1 HEAT repeat domain-containing protein [Sulfidibacter corallicola]